MIHQGGLCLALFDSKAWLFPHSDMSSGLVTSFRPACVIHIHPPYLISTWTASYDEDVLLDSELYEPDPRGLGQVLDEAKQKAAAIRGHPSLSKYVADACLICFKLIRC